MPLSPCRDCGQTVSDRAEWCPRCGTPFPTSPEEKLHSRTNRPVAVSIPRIAVGTFLGWLMIGACLMVVWIFVSAMGLAILGGALGAVR